MLVAVLVAATGAFSPVPAGGITLHVSVVPSEIPRLESVARRIVWPFAQCFSAVSVVVDPPHGGKTYGATRQSDPVHLPITPWDSRGVRGRVRRAMRVSIRMLAAHCRRRPRLHVGVLNHTRLEPWFARVFADPAVPVNVDPVFRDDRPDLPRRQRLFKNTAMYVWSIATCRTRYMLHADVDMLGLRTRRPFLGHAPPPAHFVHHAIGLLHPDILFVVPSECGSPSVETRTARISLRIFLVHTVRFASMLPLQMWANHVEDMLNYNMRRLKKSTLVLPVGPCIASSYVTRVILRNTNW